MLGGMNLALLNARRRMAMRELPRLAPWAVAGSLTGED